MNWFERHLNWTVVFVLVALYPIDFVIGFLGALFLYAIDPYMADETAEAIVMTVALILNFVLMFLVGTWALKKKARNLWNLLWLIVPFGIIVFLCLENQAEIVAQEIQELDSETEEKLHRIWERKKQGLD